MQSQSLQERVTTNTSETIAIATDVGTDFFQINMPHHIYVVASVSTLVLGGEIHVNVGVVMKPFGTCHVNTKHGHADAQTLENFKLHPRTCWLFVSVIRERRNDLA